MDLIERIGAAVKELGLDSNVIMDISTRVFEDYHPKLQYAYLFANTKDNQSSIFESAYHLQQKSLANQFLVVDGLEKNGFPGYEKWLRELGPIVGNANILPVPIKNPECINTYSESLALIDYTLKQGIESLYVVAPQFHQLRAFMTAASEAIKRNPRLNIFNYLGGKLSLDEVALHSQGTLRDKRGNFIAIEVRKIKEYANILPPNKILEYLQNRRIT